MATPYEVEKVAAELVRQEVYPHVNRDYKERAKRLLRVAEDIRRREQMRSQPETDR